MDTSYLPYVNSLLINYPDAVLPSKHYYIVNDLNSDPSGYTIFIRKGVTTFFPSKVTDSGSRGFILHYLDVMTPRPFDEDKLKVKLISSMFEGQEIFEISPVHTIMVLRVKNTTMDLDFDEETPLVHVSWEK
jgi:hypothetical protein